ncbi:MAG: hypothetical protein R3C18_27880 [Planctomycetaceae bacterium]
MELIILQPVVTRSLSLRKGDQISSEIIGEPEALVWLNAGIAEAIKKPRKRREVS